jgi:hypothetical protein
MGAGEPRYFHNHKPSREFQKCLRSGRANCGTDLQNVVRGRPQRFCSDKCRKAHSRINGHEIRSDRQSYSGGENTDLAPSQPIENIEAVCPLIQERGPSRRHANSAKELHFEEWPKRGRPTAASPMLTDGKQLNTGYGRASRPLGYVMEISPGRWVARVGNLSSEPLSLGSARKAAVALHRSKDQGQPRDWMRELNCKLVTEINRETELCSGHEPIPTETLKGDDYPLQTYSDGFPKLPACLDRRPWPAMAEPA